MKRSIVASLALAGIAFAGCSAYQSTYDREMQTLEQKAAADRAAQEAAHEAAARYAAIVYFAVGSAEIGQEGQRELSWFVTQMQPYPQAMFDVQGFTDSTGGEATNAQLARQRADAVANALAGLGIAPERLVVQGFGETSPAATNVTKQGRRNNRRVEVTVR